MSHNKYFQDELNYLRELGAIFAQKNPSLSRMLSEDGDDPDVERLLEGFAFLTGRIRQKLEDDIPEISHSLIEQLWPNYLRPLPAMSILEFKPRLHILTEQQHIARGATVLSAEVDGTSCEFRTTYDVNVGPYALVAASLKTKTDSKQLALDFQFESGIKSDDLNLDSLRLYLHDDQKKITANVLYLCLFRYLNNIEVTVKFLDDRPDTRHRLANKNLKPVGFGDNENLLPSSEKTFSGYRLLQEYFQLPQKFLFVDIDGLSDILGQAGVASFTLNFNFSKLFIDDITKDNFKLFCSPIVNLFPHYGSPVRLDNKRIEYYLTPNFKHQEHIEIFSVDRVEGKVKGKNEIKHYSKYEDYQHHNSHVIDFSGFYKIRKTPSILHDGIDHFLYVQRTDTHSIEVEEVVSTSLTCTNRDLASALQVGQIAFDNGQSPDFVTFRNVLKATEAQPPPIEHSLHWKLVTHLALQYQSLGTSEAIKYLIKYYDLAAFNNRQRERANLHMSEGIEKVETTNIDQIVKGIPVSGLKTTLHLRESKFGAKGHIGEANMFLFASVLNNYFTQYIRVNSFHVTEVVAVESGEKYVWNSQSGQRRQC